MSKASVFLVVFVLFFSGAFAFFPFFQPSPPPFFFIVPNDVNGEDLNINDLWARNIDANSVTSNYQLNVTEIDLNVLHDGNFQGNVGVAGDYYGQGNLNIAGDTNIVDLGISGGIHTAQDEISLYAGSGGSGFGGFAVIPNLQGDRSGVVLYNNSTRDDYGWMYYEPDDNGLYFESNFGSIVFLPSDHNSVFQSNIVPDMGSDGIYDLGRPPVQRWRNLWLTGDANVVGDINTTRVQVAESAFVGEDLVVAGTTCFDTACNTQMYKNTITGALRIDVVN